MPRLILVRHGQTAWNIERRYLGQSDVALDACGQQQAQALAERLRHEVLGNASSSDLRRALRTAEVIMEQHPGDVRPDPRLREINMGDWEGMTFGEIQAQDPERLAKWVENPLGCAPPHGETVADLAARVESLLAELRLHAEEETILIVSHGGTLSIMLCLVLGIPSHRRWQIRLDPASVSELWLYENGGIVTALNDRHHLMEDQSCPHT